MINLTRQWEESGKIKTRPPSWITYAEVSEKVLDILLQYFPTLEKDLNLIRTNKPHGQRSQLKKWCTSIKQLAHEKGLLKSVIGGSRNDKGVYAVNEIASLYEAYLKLPCKVKCDTLIKEVDTIINLRKEGLSALAIANAIGGKVSQDTVRRVMITKSVDTSRNLLCKNPDYFSSIDSDNKAYVLGFIWADGNIKKDLTTLSLTVQAQDKYMLEQINIEMNNTTPLSKVAGGKHYSLRVHSKQLVFDLTNYGLLPAKTLDIDWPCKIPQEFLPSFIRGLFDGDGTTSYYVTTRPSRPGNKRHSIGFSICCSWKVGKQFKDYLISKGIKVIIYPHPGCNVTLKDGRHIKGDKGKVCIVQGGGFRSSLNFAELIYSNCGLHLDRKRAKFRLGLNSYKGLEDFSRLYWL